MRRVQVRVFVSFAVTLLVFVTFCNIAQIPIQAAPLAQVGQTSTPVPTATSLPSSASDFLWNRVPSSQITAVAGASVVVSNLQLENNGPRAEFEIIVNGLPEGIRVSVAPNRTFELESDTSRDLTLQLTLETGVTGGSYPIEVVAVRTAVFGPVVPNLTVTPTPNQTPTPLVGAARTRASAFFTLVVTAGSPTATPPACPEQRDPGNRFEDADLLRVDREETHGICRTGDEDWFSFAGVGGKRYTIDVPEMDAGLDLALQLFNDQRNLLDENDDYPLRNATPVITDTRPQINSFRAPRDGFYIIRLYDTLGIGGANLTYKIVVRSEGYAEQPIVPSICNDLFEPDGLPEQARTILGNGRHSAHRLCPAGDADWVKFFGSTELIYYLYTDTTSANDGKSQPGADTVMYLFGRDGVTLIDSNNNAPGTGKLDSQITFQPPADGTYYAQIKNVGDVGDNFITYDLILDACVPNADNCGRPLVSQPVTATPTATPVDEFVLDTPTPTP